MKTGHTLLELYRFPSCRPVKRLNHPHFTRRFAMHVGRMCLEQSLSRVAQLLRLSWHTVKDLEKQYLQKLVDRAGTPTPRAIGIDEISIRKGHVYRIVVSDLERKRPIWFGGNGHREEDLEMFFAWLGPRKTAKIRLAVMAAKWTIKSASDLLRARTTMSA